MHGRKLVEGHAISSGVRIYPELYSTVLSILSRRGNMHRGKPWRVISCSCCSLSSIGGGIPALTIFPGLQAHISGCSEPAANTYVRVSQFSQCHSSEHNLRVVSTFSSQARACIALGGTLLTHADAIACFGGYDACTFAGCRLIQCCLCQVWCPVHRERHAVLRAGLVWCFTRGLLSGLSWQRIKCKSRTLENRGE